MLTPLETSVFDSPFEDATLDDDDDLTADDVDGLFEVDEALEVDGMFAVDGLFEGTFEDVPVSPSSPLDSSKLPASRSFLLKYPENLASILRLLETTAISS